MNINQKGELYNLIPLSGVTVADVPVADTAVPLAALDSRATVVVVHVSGGTIRATIDGSTPTASHGTVWFEGAEIIMNPHTAGLFQAIRKTSTSGLLHVTVCQIGNGVRL